MARHCLKEHKGKRLRFTGVFERYGSKRAYRGPDLRTVLLVDVRLVDTGQIVTDHLWFTETKGLSRLERGLEPGDTLTFDARVETYKKGYQGRRAKEWGEDWTETDYRLKWPTKWELQPVKRANYRF